MILRNVCTTQERKFLNKTPLFILQNYDNSDKKSFNNETCFLIELIQQLKELICDDLWLRSLVEVIAWSLKAVEDSSFSRMQSFSSVMRMFQKIEDFIRNLVTQLVINEMWSMK